MRSFGTVRKGQIACDAGNLSALTRHEQRQSNELKPHISLVKDKSAETLSYSRDLQPPVTRFPSDLTRQHRKRVKTAKNAARFAFSSDLPLNVMVTISWDALLLSGDHNDGHCLGVPPIEREERLRRGLRRLCARLGIPFACIWARAIGSRLGNHVHLLMFVPSREIDGLVDLLELITGSGAAFVGDPYAQNTVARSMCGGWQVEMNGRDLAGSLEAAEYLAHQALKHPQTANLEGRVFGVSSVIGSSAQERGEVAKAGKRFNVADDNDKPTASDLGLRRKEVHDARGQADAAFHAAKSAARVAKVKKAHDDLQTEINELIGEAMKIEVQAAVRLADEYDVAQERGEVGRTTRKDIVVDGNDVPSAADLGLRRDEIHNARKIRDADKDALAHAIQGKCEIDLPEIANGAASEKPCADNQHTVQTTLAQLPIVITTRGSGEWELTCMRTTKSPVEIYENAPLRAGETEARLVRVTTTDRQATGRAFISNALRLTKEERAAANFYGSRVGILQSGGVGFEFLKEHVDGGTGPSSPSEFLFECRRVIDVAEASLEWMEPTRHSVQMAVGVEIGPHHCISAVNLLRMFCVQGMTVKDVCLKAGWWTQRKARRTVPSRQSDKVKEKLLDALACVQEAWDKNDIEIQRDLFNVETA